MRPGRFLRDARGAALTEFGLILPVVAVLLIGAMDIGHTLYMRSVMEGALQKAARDSGLESGTIDTTQAAIDGIVREQLLDLGLEDSQIEVTRRHYRTFSQASAAAAEPYDDSNDNGECDNGEPFQDNNNNEEWDADGADGGQGGAEDTVVYTVSLEYPRMFPLSGLIGVSDTVRMSASTVMNNQPYGEQDAAGAPTVGNCT
jgi:Flp pilus assembly protein TadG